MTFTPILIPELCNEHTAVHIHFPEQLTSDLIHTFEERNAFIADISLPSDADGPATLAEFLSQALNFPRITTNWNAVNDWATDEEFIGNPVASLVIVRNLASLTRQHPEDRALAIKLWARGPRIYQFQEQAFHAVLVGDDPPEINIAAVFLKWVPVYRMDPEMLANIGYGSGRIPVYDWQTDPPTLLIE